MRDAVGHGAPTLGLVAGDVRAGRVHQGDGPPASRRSDCVHRGDVDAWRYADARALSAAERREIRQSHETTVPAAERQAEPRRRLGAGATGPGNAARRAHRARADQPGRRDQGRQTADAGRTRRLVPAARDVDRSGTCGSRGAAQAADVGEPAALLPDHEHPVRLGVRRHDQPHHAERECHQDGVWRSPA